MHFKTNNHSLPRLRIIFNEKAWSYEHVFFIEVLDHLNNSNKSHAHATPGVGIATNSDC